MVDNLGFELKFESKYECELHLVNIRIKIHLKMPKNTFENDFASLRPFYDTRISLKPFF